VLLRGSRVWATIKLRFETTRLRRKPLHADDGKRRIGNGDLVKPSTTNRRSWFSNDIK
jgi:hypothetical protein